MSTIRTGIWTDHSQNGAHSIILTLESRTGVLLLAFFAAYVTFCAGQLWRIIVYLVHQIRVDDKPHDALHFQQQSIWRNSSTPYSAAWSFLMQCWSWRRTARAPYRRTLPWALFALSNALVFAVAAVFSAQISSSASQVRLLQADPETCGFVGLSDDPTQEAIGSQSLLRTISGKVERAVSYARRCYGNDASSLDCGTLQKPALSYTTVQGIACPFEAKMCWADPVRFQTSLLDSFHDFGINGPPEDRLQIRLNATCAPLATETYEEWLGVDETTEMGWGEDTLRIYNFGPLYDANGETVQNWTYLYNRFGVSGEAYYTVKAFSAIANTTLEDRRGWVPIPELASEIADTSIMLVAFNAVLFQEPTEDGIFYATTPTELGPGFPTVYAPDFYVGPVACMEQLQICNPLLNRCAPWGSRDPLNWSFDLGLTPGQEATKSRFALAVFATSIANSITPRRGSALRAQETLYDNLQLPVPNTQWQIEVRSWFEDTLAWMQHNVQSYTQNVGILPGLQIERPWTWNDTSSEEKQVYRSMCVSQVVRDAQGTLSFSVLGLTLLLVLGGIITVVSFTLESVVELIRSYFQIGYLHRLAWVSDGTLNVQQMLLEGRGFGNWHDTTSAIPVTKGEEAFGAGSRLTSYGQHHTAFAGQ